jgi:hypothetical protein
MAKWLTNRALDVDRATSFYDEAMAQELVTHTARLQGGHRQLRGAPALGRVQGLVVSRRQRTGQKSDASLIALFQREGGGADDVALHAGPHLGRGGNVIDHHTKTHRVRQGWLYFAPPLFVNTQTGCVEFP